MYTLLYSKFAVTYLTFHNEGVSAAEKLVKQLEDCSPSTSPWYWEPDVPVVLLIYFDEAQDMTINYDLEISTIGIGAGSKQTITSYRTAYMALLSALADLSYCNIFAIFMSTNINLAKNTPPPRRFSYETLEDTDYYFQPPFVDLPIDLWEEVHEDQHRLEDVCQPEFMVRFGRPL